MGNSFMWRLTSFGFNWTNVGTDKVIIIEWSYAGRFRIKALEK